MKYKKLPAMLITVGLILSLMSGCGPSQISGLEIKTTQILLNVGSRNQVSVTVTPEDSDPGNLSYYSENPRVATFEDGTVTGISEGQTQIYVTSKDGMNTSSKIKVIVEDRTKKLLENAAG